MIGCSRKFCAAMTMFAITQILIELRDEFLMPLVSRLIGLRIPFMEVTMK
jgi:hypothetical protein